MYIKIDIRKEDIKNRNNIFGFEFGETKIGNESVIELDSGWKRGSSNVISEVNTELDVFNEVMSFGNDNDLNNLIAFFKETNIESKCHWLTYAILNKRYHNNKGIQFVNSLFEESLTEIFMENLINNAFKKVKKSYGCFRKAHDLELIDLQQLKDLENIKKTLHKGFEYINSLKNKKFTQFFDRYSSIPNLSFVEFIKNDLIVDCANKKHRSLIKTVRSFEHNKYKRDNGIEQNGRKKQKKGRK